MDTTPLTIPHDPRPRFATALNTAQHVVRSITDEQQTLPTPCDEFDVRTLTWHLIGVLERIRVMAHGGDILTVPLVLDVADDELVGLWEQRAAAALAAWEPDHLLTTTINLPWATLPGFAALSMYVNEVTVHAWDLATATGQTPRWDDEVTSMCLTFMQQALPKEGREFTPFAPVVPAGNDATLIDQLVAWNGRQPR